MNFIYDIVLNFNKEYYYFFEWSKKDNVINIKKIPFFLIDYQTFKIFRENNVTVNKEFIDVLRDKTLTYTRTKIGPSCLVTNGKEVMGLLFNDNGVVIKKSSLLLDEEEEVIDEIVSDSVYKIDIIDNKKGKRKYVNRIEKEKKDFLINYISKEKNNINLKYLYYDYFEKEEKDIETAKVNLINEIKKNWNTRFNELYETVKLFNKIKN